MGLIIVFVACNQNVRRKKYGHYKEIRLLDSLVLETIIFLVTVTKYFIKAIEASKEGFVLAHRLGTQFFMTGKEWWQQES